jgi:hypothetical protein
MTEERDFTATMFDLYDAEAGTPLMNCVYVTAELCDDLQSRYGSEHRPDHWTRTFTGVPVVINHEMATVGGRSWEISWRHRPRV